ncbi:hypothetical protein D3C85_1849130 [compost metagenome]
MKYCEIPYLKHPKLFYISFSGIHFHTHTWLKQRRAFIKVKFWGYYEFEKFELLKKNIKKKIKRKIKNILKYIE